MRGPVLFFGMFILHFNSAYTKIKMPCIYREVFFVCNFSIWKWVFVNSYTAGEKKYER